MSDDVTVRLLSLSCYGYHGVHDEEREHGQRFVVDVEITLSAVQAGETDALDDTIDYGKIAEIVTDVIQGPSVFLLERLGAMIADRILEDQRVTNVAVTLLKPDLEMEGSAKAAVTLRRSR